MAVSAGRLVLWVVKISTKVADEVLCPLRARLTGRRVKHVELIGFTVNGEAAVLFDVSKALRRMFVAY